MPLQIRIDVTTIPALVFGAVLVVVAGILGVVVWRIRQGLEPILEGDPEARLHADRQLRRRLQISAMLATVGILIATGDQLDQVFLQRPILFVLWVGVILMLVLWIVLMAIGDWMSTISYSAIARTRLRFERRALESEIQRYHAEREGQSLDDLEDPV